MSAHRPLTAADLLAAGPLRRLGAAVRLFDAVQSTNTDLLTHAAELPDGTLAHAESQTGGRGRLGRRWQAVRGSSVLLSALLIEPDESPLVGVVSLIGAVAAAEAVEGVTSLVPTIRWPNDLTLNGRKLGGVLAETTRIAAAPASGPRRAIVIGVGLNCLQQRGHFGEDVQNKASSLELESPASVDRAGVAAALVAQLDAWITRAADAAGRAALLGAWRSRCDDVGQHATLQDDGRTYSGTIVDIAADGDLVVQLDDGTRRPFAAATTTRAW